MKYAIAKSEEYEYLLETEWIHWWAVAVRDINSNYGWTRLSEPFSYQDIIAVIGPMRVLTYEEAFIELI